MSALRYAFVFGTSLVLMTCCSCKKSEKDELSHDDLASMGDDAAASVKTALTNWAITNGVDLKTNQQLVSTTVELAEAARKGVASEVTFETFAATAVLKQLQEHGHLPGVSKGEHGQVTFDTVPLFISNKLAELTFPTLRTFRLVKNGETSTNNYTLVKQTKDSDWKLQKAWLTDSNGQIIKEWPIQ